MYRVYGEVVQDGGVRSFAWINTYKGYVRALKAAKRFIKVAITDDSSGEEVVTYHKGIAGVQQSSRYARMDSYPQKLKQGSSIPVVKREVVENKFEQLFKAAA